MATWTTELEARVKVDEELKGALMAALAAAIPEPKPALVFGSGREEDRTGNVRQDVPRAWTGPVDRACRSNFSPMSR
jgi:hypothetical protein